MACGTGDYDRAGDWVVLFERELAEAPWTDVLDRWVPRLAAGSYGSGTHTVLRTADATRSLGRRHTPQRVHELAEGLAFWAARRPRCCLRQSVPSGRCVHRPRSLEIEQLPIHDRRGWFLFTEPIDKLAMLSSFANATNLVETSGHPRTFLDDLTDV